MAKNTMGTKLPRKLEQKMSVVGEQIKLARLRRNLSVAQVAERATCSPLTVSRIEKGVPTVAIGIYLRVLYALQLDDDILWLAKEDKLGKTLQDLSLKTRKYTSFSDNTLLISVDLPNRLRPYITTNEDFSLARASFSRAASSILSTNFISHIIMQCKHNVFMA